MALSAAVQQSGLAERIGMAQSGQMIQSKMLDYFFTLKNVHGLAYQPIVELATGRLVEYECLFRPQMPGLQTSIRTVVQAAIDTDRTVELDGFIVRAILEQGRPAPRGPPGDGSAADPPRDQLHAGQPARPSIRGRDFAWMVREAGLDPRRSPSSAPSSRRSPISSCS